MADWDDGKGHGGDHDQDSQSIVVGVVEEGDGHHDHSAYTES